jgi:hypothetical protein
MNNDLHIPTPDELVEEEPGYATRRLIERCLEDLRHYYKDGGTVLVPIGDAPDEAVFDTIRMFECRGWLVVPRMMCARFSTGPHLAFVKNTSI